MEPLQTWWTTELYPTSDEDNFGVVGNFEVVKAADAQATIAAHEATILKMGENAAVVAKDAMAAKEQVAALQARVRELEQWVQDQSTANLEKMRHTDEMQSRAMEAESQLTQRTAELEAVNKHCEIIEERKAEAYKEVEIQLLAKANLQAELERVRAQIKAYAHAKIDFDDKRLQEDHHAWRERYNKLVEAENALLQHRQGMEG